MKKASYFAIIAVLLIIIGTIFYLANNRQKVELQKSEPLKIGWIGALTGGASQYGLPANRMSQIAVEEINKSGGILGQQVQLMIEDDTCDAQKAVSAFNKLVNVDKVKIIIGSHCSNSSLAIAPLANNNNVLMMAVLTAADSMSNYGDDYIFRMTVSAKYWSKGLAQILLEQKLDKNVLIYFLTEYAKSTAQSFKSSYEQLGGKILYEEALEPKQKDFQTTLLKIKKVLRDNPTATVYLSVQTPDQSALFFKQMRELGIKSNKLVGEFVALSPKVYELTGGFIEGAMYGIPYANPKENAVFEQALAQYKQKYGEELKWGLNHFANAYDAPYFLKQAIESCGSLNANCLKEKLKTTTFQGASGTYRFDANGDPAEIKVGVAVLGQDGIPEWLKDRNGKPLIKQF